MFVYDQTGSRFFVLCDGGFDISVPRSLSWLPIIWDSIIGSTSLLIRVVFISLYWMHFSYIVALHSKINQGCKIMYSLCKYCNIIIRRTLELRSATSCGNSKRFWKFEMFANIVLPQIWHVFIINCNGGRWHRFLQVFRNWSIGLISNYISLKSV